MVFLDPGFGNEGIVVTDFGVGNSTGSEVLVQRNGKILLLGLAENGSGNSLALARYMPDGSLDRGFGTGGKVKTSFLGATEVRGISGVLQPDGKLLTATSVKTGDTYDLALVRYNTDGSLDTGFGQAGQLTLDLNEGQPTGSSVVVQPNGRIVVIRSTEVQLTFGHNFELVLTGYQSNGTLDASFGLGGQTTVSLGGGFYLSAGIADAVVQPDGKILTLSNPLPVTYFFRSGQINRFNVDGSLDTSFSGGEVTVRLSKYDYFYQVQVQSNGQIVVGGGPSGSGILRYNSDGTLDSTFGTNGVTYLPTMPWSSNRPNFAVQADGKIVVKASDVLLRFNNQGNLDPTFRKTSKIPITTSTDIALTNDNKVIIAGTTQNGSETEFALTQYVLNNVVLPGPFTGDANKNVIRGNEFDNLLAGLGSDDRLIGLGGNDVLLGGNGNDKLIGGTGDDDLQGGGGNDVLQVGLGFDRVTGGKGGDAVVFNTNSRFNKEQIGIARLTDFNLSQDQVILDQDTFYTRQLRFANVNDLQAAEQAQAEIVYIKGTGALFFNPNGSEVGFGNGGNFADLPDGLALRSSVFDTQP